MPLVNNQEYAKSVGLPVEDLQEVLEEMQEFCDYQDGKIEWKDLGKEKNDLK